ncbi:MAG: mitochondrial fission ELM1 family protein [Robiginitomaculum sp.]
MPSQPELTPAPCWVISDGRCGIENQALGLAEAMGRLTPLALSRHVIGNGALFSALPPSLQYALGARLKSYGLRQNLPQIAIGCGRQAIAPLRALKKAGGTNIFTIYVQNPRVPTSCFDMVVAPAHDMLTGDTLTEDTVETMIGSPNRVTKEILNTSVQQFADKFIAFPAPRVAVLVGGRSKNHRLSRDNHTVHMQAICGLAKQGMSVMITTSRRTPSWAGAHYVQLGKDRRNVWVWDGYGGTTGDNPYFAFLGGADAILVTEDSTNMLTESCATGKPVFTLPMSGEAGKFIKLYEDLQKRCHLRAFNGSTEAPPYKPLDETARIAKIVIAKMHK